VAVPGLSPLGIVAELQRVGARAGMLPVLGVGPSSGWGSPGPPWGLTAEWCHWVLVHFAWAVRGALPLTARHVDGTGRSPGDALAGAPPWAPAVLGALLAAPTLLVPEYRRVPKRRRGKVRPLGTDVDAGAPRPRGRPRPSDARHGRQLLDYISTFLRPLDSEEFTFDRAWLRELFAQIKDPRLPSWAVGLRLNLPREYVLIHRVWLGGLGVLCQLGGTVKCIDVLEDHLPGFADS